MKIELTVIPHAEDKADVTPGKLYRVVWWSSKEGFIDILEKKEDSILYCLRLLCTQSKSALHIRPLTEKLIFSNINSHEISVIVEEET